MGLLQNLALEALSGYFPGLDLESLRLNVIKGRLDLKDVDLSPGQVFIFNGCPFRLAAGSIGQLSVHVPWTALYSAPVHVDAHRVHMQFEEIVFPSYYDQVMEALREARRRQKVRVLAESERAESVITRALQKFVPILLDRVQLNVSQVDVAVQFASGECAVLKLGKLETASLQSGGRSMAVKARPDLEKTLSLVGLEASLKRADQVLLAVDPIGATLRLGLSHGVCGFDVVLSHAIRVGVWVQFGCFMRASKKRVAFWNTPFVAKRPMGSVVDNVKDWFQYAVTAVRIREGLTASERSVNQVQEVVRCIVEYKRLHVRRLEKREALSDAEMKRITELEDFLDVDMILLLRRHARAHVLAEQVSAFATKDWLSWALFDYRMSKEREQLSAEIRQALYNTEVEDTDIVSLEGSTGRNASNAELSKGWSKAKISVTVASSRFYAVDNEGNEIALGLEGLSLRFELDSSMEVYSFSLCISDFVVTDGMQRIFHRGELNKARKVGLQGCSGKFLDIAVLKPALDKNITTTIRLVPCCLFVSTDRLSSYVEVLQSLTGSSAQDESVAKTKHIQATSSTSYAADRVDHFNTGGDDVSVVFVAPGTSVLVGRQLIAHTSVGTRECTLFVLSSCRLWITDGFTSPKVDGSCCVELARCEVDKLGEHLDLNEPGQRICDIDFSRTSCCEMMACLEFNRSAKRTLMTVSHIKVSITIPGLAAMLNNLSPVRDVVNGAIEDLSCHAGERNAQIDARLTPVISHYELELSSFELLVIRESEPGISPGGIKVTASNMRALSKSESHFTVAIQTMEVKELSCDGYVHLSGTSRQPMGLVMEQVITESNDMRDVDVSFGKAIVRVRPEAIAHVIRTALRLAQTVCNWLPRSCKRDTQRYESTVQAFDDGNSLELRLSARLHQTRVECASGSNRVRVLARNIYVVSHRGDLNGSVDDLELHDVSGFCGQHGNALKRAKPIATNGGERRLLSFSCSVTSANVHLFSVEVIVYKPFLERLVAMVTSLSTSIEDALGISSERGPQESASAPARNFSVQGSNLVICFPLSSVSTEGMRWEASHLSVTCLGNTTSFVLRKLAIHTKTDRSPAVSISQGVGSGSSHDREWTVLVRDLDVDLSRTSNKTIIQPHLSKQCRTEWHIEILSKPRLFATPSQFRLLQRIPELFENSVTTQTTSQDTCSQDNRLRDGAINGSTSEALLSVHEHMILRLVTQNIAVELLHEDQNGVIVSTLACLELEPVRLFLRNAWERESDEAISVINWTFDAPRFKLEDRCIETPQYLRDVVVRGFGPEVCSDVSATGSAEQPRKSMLTIESISRMDKAGRIRSSLEVELQNLKSIPSTSFCERLASFIGECALTVPPVEEDSKSEYCTIEDPKLRELNGVNVASGDPITCNRDPSSQREGNSEAPCSKVSIRVSNSCLQMYGRQQRTGESHVFVQMRSFKSSMLYNAKGMLLPISQIRFRDATVALNWMPTTLSQERNHAQNLVRELWRPPGGEHLRLNDALSSRDSRVISQGIPIDSRSPFTSVPSERFRWNFFRQYRSVQPAEQILHIRSGVFQLPASGTRSVTWVVSSLTLQAPVRRLLRFFYLISALDMFPLPQGSSAPRFPAIQLSINGFSIRVQVPTTKPDAASNSLQNQAHIRIRGKITLAVNESFSEATASLQVAADSVDEDRGMRDQIVSLSTIEAHFTFGTSPSLSISSERLLRIVVSPLTARVMTSLVLHLVPPRKSSTHSNSLVAVHRRPERRTEPSSISGMDLFMNLRGLVVSGVAEEPRVQMMRLAFREVQVSAFLPFLEGAGKLECSIQGMVLEDTVSWRFFGREHALEDNVRWSYILSGHRIEKPSVPPQRAKPTLLTRPIQYLIGGNEARRNDPGLASSEESERLERNRREDKSTSLLHIAVAWRSPFGHVHGHVDLTGLELNLDMGVVPRFLEWMETVRREAIKVFEGYEKRFQSRSANAGHGSELGTPFTIGIDHFVVSAIEFKVSTRAPPRRIREFWSRRVLMWLFGSESATGVLFQTPRFVFNGDFDSADRFFYNLRVAYTNALISTHMMRQIIWQLPYLSRLVRVVTTSLLRRRRAPKAFGIQQTHSSSPAGSFTWDQISIGLKEALTAKFQPPSTRSRLLTGPDKGSGSHVSRGKTVVPRSEWNQEHTEIETVDLTDDRKDRSVRSHEVEGRELLRWLRRSDERVPLDDSFDFYAPYSADLSLLVTSTYVLFVSPRARQIEEPIIRKSHISQYHLTGHRITIIWAQPAQAPVARTVARQQSRDTSSLAQKVTERTKISEIHMHELECVSPQYAAWLRSQLPLPNKVLQELLG